MFQEWITGPAFGHRLLVSGGNPASRDKER